MDSWIGRLGVRFLWTCWSSIQRLCPNLFVVFRCKENTTLFLIQVRGMTNVRMGIFFQKCGLGISFPLIVCKSPCDVIEHRHEKILPVEFSGVSSDFNSNSLTFLTELQRIESWNTFHSDSIGSPLQNTTKIPREDTPQRDNESETVAGKGRKSAKFWASHPGAPPFGATPFGPHPSALPSHPLKTKNWQNAVRPNLVNKNWPNSAK